MSSVGQRWKKTKKVRQTESYLHSANEPEKWRGPEEGNGETDDDMPSAQVKISDEYTRCGGRHTADAQLLALEARPLAASPLPSGGPPPVIFSNPLVGK